MSINRLVVLTAVLLVAAVAWAQVEPICQSCPWTTCESVMQCPLSCTDCVEGRCQ